MTQPSKLPWAIHETSPFGIIDGDDESIAQAFETSGWRHYDPTQEKRKANALLIVEAVNSHSALVARVAKLEWALERIVKADAYRMAVIASRDQGKLNHADEQFWSAIDLAQHELAGRA